MLVLTATAMANECIPASASATLELIKPPYDFVVVVNSQPARGRRAYPTPYANTCRIDVLLRSPCPREEMRLVSCVKQGQYTMVSLVTSAVQRHVRMFGGNMSSPQKTWMSTSGVSSAGLVSEGLERNLRDNGTMTRAGTKKER